MKLTFKTEEKHIIRRTKVERTLLIGPCKKLQKKKPFGEKKVFIYAVK